MTLGLLRETKIPPDFRTPLIPEHCRQIRSSHPGLEMIVQSSDIRCFPDEDYRALDIPVMDSLTDCDVLVGVKEVALSALIPEKTYMFFSHTIKKQPYNRGLLRKILDDNIRLIDYELITDSRGERLIAFGVYAGMVGAHNALYAYGERTGTFHLPRMVELEEYKDAKKAYAGIEFPPVRIVLTGTGRVGTGAARVLRDMGIREVLPHEFLHTSYDHPVFTQLDNHQYVAHKNKGTPYKKQEFYRHPERYRSIFKSYTNRADIFINGIYWDKRAPKFFSLEDMKADEFSIEVIADISCDIAPESSVPSTIRPSTIGEPVYGFDPRNGKETEPFREDCIDVMAIDNLPNELARDASRSFGDQFVRYIIPELLKAESDMLRRATIAKEGRLTEDFTYLSDYVAREAGSQGT